MLVRWATLKRLDWLIIYGFTSRSRIFHLYGDITITGEGLQNLGLCSALRAFWAGRDLYRATPAVTRDLGFPGLVRRSAPFSRLVRHTKGCGGSILTRILTGLKEIRENGKQQLYCHTLIAKIFHHVHVNRLCFMSERRHYCWWRAANLGLCSSLRAF
jgi:hypothetical protein